MANNPVEFSAPASWVPVVGANVDVDGGAAGVAVGMFNDIFRRRTHRRDEWAASSVRPWQQEGRYDLRDQRHPFLRRTDVPGRRSGSVRAGSRRYEDQRRTDPAPARSCRTDVVQVPPAIHRQGLHVRKSGRGAARARERHAQGRFLEKVRLLRRLRRSESQRQRARTKVRPDFRPLEPGGGRLVRSRRTFCPTLSSSASYRSPTSSPRARSTRRRTSSPRRSTRSPDFWRTRSSSKTCSKTRSAAFPTTRPASGISSRPRSTRSATFQRPAPETSRPS